MKNDQVRVITDRQTDGQAENNRAPQHSLLVGRGTKNKFENLLHIRYLGRAF